MSHYKPYPAYKDSGVEWLGMVPEHWDVRKLKWLASLQSGDFITSETIEEEGEYPVYGGNGLRGYCAAFTHEGAYALVGRQGALCGNINYADGKFWASEHAVVVSPYVPTAVRWLGELLRAMNLGQYSVSSAQPGLAVERIIDLFLPVPPESERQIIAVYMGRETARIDALIEKKTRFIELLREKRQALITHAVTKGLDPNVRMKDSGVEWLGEVPEHWKMLPLKRLISSIGQGWSPECEARIPEEGEWGVVKVGCVNGGVFRPEESKALPTQMESRPELSLRAGDVLISRANTRELVGSCAVVPHDYPYLMLCDKLYRVGCGERVTPDFLAALVTVYGRRAVEIEATGASSSMVNIAQSVILDLLVAVPDADEQVEIISRVSAATTRIEHLREKTERSIKLLKERRSALITAAVTGQIDLREAV
ncbi:MULTISPECIES: restriction endonuclease subunit S [unclassified Pseudomonas]|uniref:restriction endonuclease subunit S n=1 Tax=unclassified Pseudomonas TaxID=196821 RepID=UPI000C881615|nr:MULTISPECIES: restriction endonuclease subunit S [unclassified Pseudomonas]PMZ91894.1 restriction endonuclease subunit S [Pseudomonas sp. FW215-T2]PNA16096.1 restriction endonuclease subunit S [Pseudomonas sp. FW215-R3]PNB39840.1 restriction endonuclease subunit S [Pseudomonas sp. FW305-131]